MNKKDTIRAVNLADELFEYFVEELYSKDENKFNFTFFEVACYLVKNYKLKKKKQGVK